MTYPHTPHPVTAYPNTPSSISNTATRPSVRLRLVLTGPSPARHGLLPRRTGLAGGVAFSREELDMLGFPCGSVFWV